jgi:hypothetical protein
MKASQRERILDHLRQPPGGGWAVVANARCLGEGIDIPAIDAVLFASPRESVTDVAQAAGRALRRHEGGTGIATIIVPVIIPASGGEITDLESGAYETVWRVVNAMREHDDALATNLDFARAHWKRAYPADPDREPALPSRITVIVPSAMGDRLAAALSLAVIQHASSPWWDGYARAQDFHAEHQHLAVPNRHTCADGFNLGQWIRHNRRWYLQGMLPPERVEALEKLGMLWNARDAKWDTFCQAAAAYRDEHGDLLIPRDYRTPDGLNLGLWIRFQRRMREKMDPARRDRLDGLGMEWGTHRGPRPEIPGAPFGVQYVRAYRGEFGTADVPQRYRAPDGFALGWWVSKVRAQRKAGTLGSQVAAELEALGFRWQIKQRRNAQDAPVADGLGEQ